MPQFGRQGDLHTIVYITGPRHLWLGLEFSRDKAEEPVVVQRPAIGDCGHGEIDEARLVAAVNSGCDGTGLHATRIEYCANDSPVYRLYAICAHLLAERAQPSVS